MLMFELNYFSFLQYKIFFKYIFISKDRRKSFQKEKFEKHAALLFLFP